MNVTEVVSIVSTLVVAPAIVFLFIYKIKKNKTDIEKLKYEKEVLELEIEKQNNQMKLLAKESEKYDKLIYGQ
jgi:hypothetical protein